MNRILLRVSAAAATAAGAWLATACVEDSTTGEPFGSVTCGQYCADASLPPNSPGAGVSGGGGAASGSTSGWTPVGAGGNASGSGASGSAGGSFAGGTAGGAAPGGAAAGGGPGELGGGPGGASGDLPCDVKAIVEQRCGSCHGSTPASAPMSLARLADWQAPSVSDKTKSTYQLAKVRINAAGNAAMPPPSIGTLTPEEKAKLNAWLDQSAPAGNMTCTNSTSGPREIDTTGLECHKLLAHAPGSKTAKYKVGAATDAYINFGFQAPWRSTLYMQVIKPVIDNPKVVHHWLLYREPVADGSVEATIGQHVGGELLNGWAPGGEPSDLRPKDVAMELPVTTYSVEIHYNSSDPSAQDASGVEVCGRSTPPKNVASLAWLGYANGGALSYATGFCLEPSTSWTGTCNPGHTQPIHIVSVTPHLHESGRHIKAMINGPNGSRVLHDKAFDFAYQVTYEKDEVLMPGESITTTCTFSQPQCAGQSTGMEMCYLYTLHYPRNTLTDFGPEGILMHGEGVCLGQ